MPLKIETTTFFSFFSPNGFRKSLIISSALFALSAFGVFYLNRYLSPSIAPKPSKEASLKAARLCTPNAPEKIAKATAERINNLIESLAENTFLLIANEENSPLILVGRVQDQWIVQKQERIERGLNATVILTQDFAIRGFFKNQDHDLAKAIQTSEKGILIRQAVNPDGKTPGIQPPGIGTVKSCHIIKNNRVLSFQIPCEVSTRYENNLLHFFSKKTQTSDANTVRKACGHIASGMNTLFQKGICQSDLKPENVLYGRDGRIDICDFEGAVMQNSKTLSSDITTRMIHINDMDRLFSHKSNSNTHMFYQAAEEAAIFSMGSTFYQIACLHQGLGRLYPYTMMKHNNMNFGKKLQNKEVLNGNMSKIFGPLQRSLILSMLDPDPHKRPLPDTIAKVFPLSGELL